MTHRTKIPLIQSIVPNLEDYLQDVRLFYHDKVELIIYKINQFIQVATELTEIPEHLAMEFSQVKLLRKEFQEEKEIERLMVRDEIEKFLTLKNEVIEYPTGTKFLYPELPKIQRNLNKRKYSKSDSMSEDSEKFETESKESINQICNLLGTLNLESERSEEICDSIENIVDSMNGLSLQESSVLSQVNSAHNVRFPHPEQCHRQQSPRSNGLEKIRRIKKVELRRFELYLFEKCEQMDEENFKQICQQKLLQIKQLFRTHLEKSVTDVVKDIERILSKALKDIKEHDKAYVPIHKISGYFNKLNLRFYRSEGVIKCLLRYLTKKVKECVMDGVQTFTKQGVEIQVKTNFRLRFFKHIILQNIFFMWLNQAVVDFNRMVSDDSSSQDKVSERSEKIESQKDTAMQVEDEEMPEVFLLPGTGDSYNNFIM